MSPPSVWDGPPAAGDPAGQVDDRHQVREAVVDAVRTRPEMVADPERLDGYLRDVCPLQPAEVAVVVVAARAGVAEELAQASEGHHAEATAARAAKRLNAESGIDQGLARWAVDTWAVAVSAPAPLPSAGAGDPAAPAQVLLPADAGPPAPAAALPQTLAPPPPPGAAPEPETAEEWAPAGSGKEAEVLQAMVVRPSPPAPGAPAPPEASKGRPAHPPPPPPTPVGEQPPRTVQRPRRPAPAPAEAPPGPAGRRRTLVLGAGAAAACALVIALVAALVGGGSEEPRTSPTSVATPSSSPPVTTATSSTLAVTTTVMAAPRPFPAGTTPVTPGFYATSTFQPRLIATLDDGWKVHTETSDDLELGRSDSDTDFLSILNPRQVLRGNGVFATKVAVNRAGATEPAPADVVPWLRSHSRLRVSDPTPVTRAGVQGVQLDVVVTNGYDSEVCLAPCLPLFPLEGDQVFSLLAGHINRFYVLTVGGDQVVVVIEANAERFGAFVEQANRLVDTVAFKG